MEEIKKDILVLYKNAGKFYSVIGNDAIILNFLFDYKIIKDKVSFPDSALNEVLNVIKDNNISYQIVYTDRNPMFENFELNKYEDVYQKAINSQKINERLEIIIQSIKKKSYQELDNILSNIEQMIE